MPMSDFLQLVFRVFFSALGGALVCMIVGAIAIVKLHDKLHPGKSLPGRRLFLFTAFLGYLFGLLAITMLFRQAGQHVWQTHLFSAFWEAWHMFSLHFWLLYLLNIAMFIPLGVLLPLVARPFRRWYVTIPVGFGVSLLIECVQSLFAIGSPDVDDLFCNTLGSALGYCLCMVVLSLAEKRPKRMVAYGVFLLLSAAALAGIFITYYTQPYGNLMDGPLHRADTGTVEWVVDCQLSEEPPQVGVYYATPFDHDSALAFGEAFAEKHGKVITEIENYDEWILIRNPIVDEAGFSLHINLADRSYRYRNSSVAWQQLDSGTLSEDFLRGALSEYDIHIPEEAVLTYDEELMGEGRYRFDARQILEGDTLTDGYVLIDMTAEGEVGRIENYMQTSRLAATETILSEAEAYRRLREGRFLNSNWFEQWVELYHPSEARVLSCRLEYITDTKGYRQPVYAFVIADQNGETIVPALRDYRGP